MTRTILAAVVGVCTGIAIVSAGSTIWAGTFGDDLAFLDKHTPVVVLSDDSGKLRWPSCPITRAA